MKNENFLVTVIRIEMPKVHGQTLIYREYHKSCQKREEPFKKFTQLLIKTHRTKRLILEQENYTRNKTFSAIKLYIVLKEHINYTLLLISSLQILGGITHGRKRWCKYPDKKTEIKVLLGLSGISVQELWCTPGKADLLPVLQTHFSSNKMSGYCSTIPPSVTLLTSTLSLRMKITYCCK